MATINGVIYDSFSPISFSNSAKSLSLNWRSNYLVSANVPKRYQVRWNGLNEAQTPLKTNGTANSGDIINMVFYVYATTRFENGVFPSNNANWDLVGTIKKSRDIANKQYNSNNTLANQRFTVDISQICQDLLSYSLVPINKGTWQSSLWGGMNGGQTKQDNVAEDVSLYNVTPNGSYRHIKVVAIPEVILSTGLVVEATEKINFTPITVINSVHQYEKDEVWLFDRFPIGNGAGGFLSYCPNNSSSIAILPKQKKSVRVDETAEWLYFYIRRAAKVAGAANRVNLKVITSDGNTFYVNDFADNLDYDGSASEYYEKQNKMCVQNVSVDYLNSNAKQADGTAYTGSKITASTTYYTISLWFTGSGFAESRMSEYRWFNIDREDEKLPYDFVRFYWLNRMGAIDSYTAKRSVIESISVNRDTIETKSADRTWYQDNDDRFGTLIPDADYISNTMRGGNLYKGGREVLNVNAQKNNSVYTEPLNKNTAEWLQEIMTSPNVWIEMDTDATARGNTVNSYQRPSTKEYIPVIITNSDVETVNQEAGLVKFNIEYTLSHKVQTQRN
jgi:hypothetical protein|tara:strand:- start:93 stop:1775 length:1683 start_codon:yes stop_codon:yes gene_type:complete